MLPTSAPSTALMNVVHILQDLEGLVRMSIVVMASTHCYMWIARSTGSCCECCIPSLALLVCGMTSFSFLVSGMPITMLILLCGTNSDTPSLVQPTSQYSLTRSCYIGRSSPRVLHSLCGCDLPILVSKSNYREV